MSSEMLLRTDDISALWPMLILDSSPTAVLQISLVIFPALQSVQMEKYLSEDSFPRSSALILLSQESQRAGFHHSLRPATELSHFAKHTDSEEEN